MWQHGDSILNIIISHIFGSAIGLFSQDIIFIISYQELRTFFFSFAVFEAAVDQIGALLIIF